MARLTLIVGGVRSGKSRFAEQLASQSTSVLYLATAQVWQPETVELESDPEMVERIEQHRQRRSDRFPAWETIEEPWDLAKIVKEDTRSECILVECITLWITNLMVGIPGKVSLPNEAIQRQVRELAEVSAMSNAHVILVSNEVGWGIIPESSLGRRFADVLGEANQFLASHAEEVFGCWAGIPLRLKPRDS